MLSPPRPLPPAAPRRRSARTRALQRVLAAALASLLGPPFLGCSALYCTTYDGACDCATNGAPNETRCDVGLSPGRWRCCDSSAYGCACVRAYCALDANGCSCTMSIFESAVLPAPGEVDTCEGKEPGVCCRGTYATDSCRCWADPSVTCRSNEVQVDHCSIDALACTCTVDLQDCSDEVGREVSDCRSEGGGS